MKRQPREVYGRGPQLRTVEDRAARFARLVLLAFLLATLTAAALGSAGALELW